MLIHQGHILLDADWQGQWLCGRGDTIGAIHPDSIKAFTGVSHSSLVASLRIQTMGWMKNLRSLGSKQSVVEA